MASTLHSVIFFVLFLSIHSVLTKDLPCSKYEGDGGYVCVCNSTYCDTISAPTKLKTGKYYHYTTSETSPGFNLEKGKFSTGEEVGNSSSDVTVYVDSSVAFQSFQGIGVGISDSSAYDFAYLSTKAQDKLMESFFGENGIEIVFGRIPIGPTDFSLTYYSYDDTVGDVNMTNFDLTDFEVETKIPMIELAYNTSSRGLKLLATPWTPPGWMKDNNATLPGFLVPGYAEAYANYIVKFLESYKEKGIEYWGLSSGNEIIMGYGTSFQMPNVIMFPNVLREWTRDYLGPKIVEAGFENLTMITLDDERAYLAWYADRLLSDSETAQYIDGVALHWYGDNENNVDVMEDFHNNYPDKLLMLTEASGGGGMQNNGQGGGMTLGSWSEAVEFIDDMIQNFNHWVEAYMTWNLCLNLQGGPDKQMSLDAPILIDTSNDLFYKQPIFYAFGHFSKFIYPGSVRVNLTVEESSSSLDEQAMPTGGPGPQPTGGSFTGGPGPRPTGGSFSGGPGPQPTGGSFTGGPGPRPTGGPGPNPTGSPTSSSFSGIASTNPDGSTTVILLNPSSDAVTLTLVDSVKGTIKKKVEANSLNTFIYW